MFFPLDYRVKNYEQYLILFCPTVAKSQLLQLPQNADACEKGFVYEDDVRLSRNIPVYLFLE